MFDYGDAVLMTATDTPAAEREPVGTRTTVHLQDSGTSYVVIDEWNDGEPLQAFTDADEAMAYDQACVTELAAAQDRHAKKVAADGGGVLPGGAIILW